MREVCAYHMLQKENDGHQIGGPNLTVEIDESLFSKRSVYSHKLSSISTVSISRKNNVGRIFPPQWVFGGICRQTRETFIVAVPDRTAETLLAVVRAKIAVGSTVMSDCWRSYNMVVVFFLNIKCILSKQLGADGSYNHLRVNHSEFCRSCVWCSYSDH